MLERFHSLKIENGQFAVLDYSNRRGFNKRLLWLSGEGNGNPLQYFAWKIPWMEEPGGLQSMGSLRVRHDWATSLSLFTFMHWRRKWQPTPVSCLENPRDRGAWWAVIYGVAESRTWLKGLSSSSSSSSSSIMTQRFNISQEGQV